MAVGTTGLDFVSRLDNSDFQAKSLQDLKLIELRLRLTGDTSGITKYDEAVKAALATETKLRADLAKILDEAKIKSEEFIQTIQTPASRTVFSDSAAEVAAYQASLAGLESGATIVAGLNEQLDVLAVSENELNAALTAGTITEAEHATALETINAEQIRLVENIKRVNDAYATNVVVEREAVVEAERNVVVVQEETNAYFELITTLKELKLARANPTTPTADLPILARQIQETEVQIAQLTNVGKVGFNEFGEKIAQTNVQAGLFSRAIDRATNVQAIGARVVSQFSRQIIGLGVGFLSITIGAKAIEALIDYIKNLDVFTGRLDVAKQTLAAFNDVLENGAKGAAKSIAELKIYSDAATDVNSALTDRIAAAEKIKELLPDETKNVNALAIANGALKDQIKELNDELLRQATIQAAISKINELEAKKIDLQVKQIELQNKANIDKSKATGYAASTTSIPGTGSGSYVPEITKAQNQAGIQQFADYKKKEIQPEIDVIEQTIKNIEQAVGGASVLAKHLEGAQKLIVGSLADFDKAIANAGNKADLDLIKKSLQAKLDALKPGDDQIEGIRAKLQKVDDLLKTYQVKATKTTNTTNTDPAIALLASQKKVLQDIDALKGKSASKDKTRNEQEVDDIKATYKKEYEAIVAQNTKLEQYLKTHTPAQAKAKGLRTIDPNEIKNSENEAVQGVKGRQSVDDTKVQIETQKALFTEYQNFKLQAGTEAANKLFGNELKGYTSYLSYLKSLQPTEADLTSTDPYTKARASALNDYLKVEIPKANDDELKAQQKHLQDLIIQDQNWQQKRVTLIATGNENIKKLNEKGFKEQAAQAKDNLDQQLTALEVSGFETQAQYRKLFSTITELSAEAAKAQIENAQETADVLHAVGDLTDDAYKKITDDLNKLKATIADRDFEKLSTIASGLESIGKAFEGINSGFGSYISSLGQLVSSLATVGKQYDQIGKDAGDAAKQQQDELNLVATGITAVVDLISVVTSASAARKKAAEDYYNSVIEFQKEYNIALDEQIRLQYQTNASIFFTDYAQELSGAADAYKKATEQYNQSLIDLQKGQAIVGQHNAVDGKSVAKGAVSGATAGAVIGSVVPVIGTVIGAVGGAIIGGLAGLFGGKKKENTLAPLLATYPQLIDANGKFNESLAKSLVSTNQVDEATKGLLNSTIAYYDEQKATIDQITTALQGLTGNLGDSIRNALVGAFKDGTDAAKAFGSSVSEVLSNIIQQDLFQAIFGEKLKALQDKLTADSLNNDGKTQAEIIADIEDFYKNAGDSVQQFEDAIKAAQQAGATQGLTLFPSTNSTGASSSLKGGIQASLTENTADILAGTLKGIQLGIYDTNRSLGQMILIAQNQLNAALLIQVNTRQTADNTSSLPEMLNQLKAISTNTEGSLGIELRAAGYYKY